jgi:D-sedoheptulose 7-phosphate isomerase
MNFHFDHLGARVALLEGSCGKLKHLVDVYVLAPGCNIEQEEDTHMILAHIITRHMREVVRSYAQELTLAMVSQG